MLATIRIPSLDPLEWPTWIAALTLVAVLGSIWRFQKSSPKAAIKEEAAAPGFFFVLAILFNTYKDHSWTWWPWGLSDYLAMILLIAGGFGTALANLRSTSLWRRVIGLPFTVAYGGLAAMGFTRAALEVFDVKDYFSYEEVRIIMWASAATFSVLWAGLSVLIWRSAARKATTKEQAKLPDVYQPS